MTPTPSQIRREPPILALLILASIALHILFVYLVEDLEKPEPPEPKKDKYVSFEVATPAPPPKLPDPPPPKPPPPEPPPQVAKVAKELEPVPPKPKPPVEKPKPKKAKKPDKPAGSSAPKPNSEPPKEPQPKAKPVFGVKMASTSPSGSGPAVPVGNTVAGDPNGERGPVNPLGPGSGQGRGTGTGDGQSEGSGDGDPDGEGDGPPVEAYTVSKMPKMRGKCRGKYTADARKAGIEGTVTLDLVVGSDGKTRDIEVVESLDPGLDASAIKALKKCRFTPADRGGKAVAVKIQGFKISFYLAR